MASQADLLLKREPAVTRLPRVVRVAATLEMGHTAAPVVGEPWDGRRSPTDLQLLGLLTGFNAGEKLPIFVHRDNAYSAAPQDLVRGRRHAPGTGRGLQGSCYFYSEPAPTKAGKRSRKVPGGTWHPEGGRKPISDGASKKSFSYLVQIHRGKQRTGWIMAEISLDTQGDGPDHMVLCVVHKSMHKYPDTSMAAGRSLGEDAAPVRDEEASVHDPLSLPGGDISSPPPVPATPQPAPSISSASTTNLLLQKAAYKAESWDFEKVCEIQEFVEFKQLHLRTIDLLGLDRSIVSGTGCNCSDFTRAFEHDGLSGERALFFRHADGSLGKLEVLLKHIAIIKKLTPDERDDVMSCGDDMSTTISMAYLNALGNRLQKEFSALGRIGFNVHNQASNRTSKVKDVFMVVHASEDMEYKRDLYSASAPLQDGVKRKADDHNHPEAPPNARQLQRMDTNRDSVVQEMAYISAFKDMERELLADTVMPPDVAGYLEDPMEFDGGGLWAGEAGEHAEIAECSAAPRRVPAEERTEMNCIALKTSRLSGVNYVGCGGPQYCFGVDSAPGDDEALLAAGSQPHL